MFQCSGSQVREDARFSYSNVYKEKYQQGRGGIIPLTLERGESYGGSITPDGKYLFFTSNRLGNYDIFLRALDDVDIIPVVQTATNQKEPAIHPDGDYIVYIDDELDPDGDLVLQKIDTDDIIEKYQKGEQQSVFEGFFSSSREVLTNNENRRVRSRESNPVWSPDGEKIAFSSDMTSIEGSPFGPGLGAMQNIWVLDPDSPEKATKVTENGGVMPSFSPDGNRIVYVSYQNRNMNGDIYEVDLRTFKTRQLTSGSALDMYPSYTGDGKSVVFTRISTDSNSDSRIDRKDRGHILKLTASTWDGKTDKTISTVSEVQQDQKTRISALTLTEENTFDTRTNNFATGSVVFSQARGEDINVAFIPTSGVIPVKENIEEQYNFSEQYHPENKNQITGTLSQEISSQDKINERYLLALQKVEDFFYNDSLYVLYGPQKDLQQLEFIRDSGGVIPGLIEESTLKAQIQNRIDDGELLYRIQADLLSYETNRHPLNLNRLFEAKDKLEYLEKASNSNKVIEAYTAVSQQETQPGTGGNSENKNTDHSILVQNYLKEKYGYELLERGITASATRVFENILTGQPDYYRNHEIIYTLGHLKLDLDIPEELLFILYPQNRTLDYSNNSKQEEQGSTPAQAVTAWRSQITSELQLRTRNLLFDFYRKRFAASQGSGVDSIIKKYNKQQFKDLHYTAELARAQYLTENDNYSDAAAALTKARETMPENSRWHYLHEKLSGEIAELNYETEKAFQHYYRAITLYDNSYEDKQISTLTHRVLNHYEQRAEREVSKNNSENAWQQYRFLADLYLQLYAKRMEHDIVEARALDTFININDLAFDTRKNNDELLESISEFYDQKIDYARRYLNNPFIFSRAYLHAQLGILKHSDYEKDGLSDDEKEDVLKLFKTAEKDFKWSFFADPYFADSYVMMGWMYQYIDEKREVVVDEDNRRKDKDEFSSLYATYFPEYLFEENIRLYQKSISYFENRTSPRVLLSFYLNIGNNYFLLNNYAKAEEYYAKVESNTNGDRVFENKRQEALFYFHLGKTRYFTSNYSKSAASLTRSLEMYEEIAPLNGVAGGQMQENQQKREIILKYLAISSDYSRQSKKAVQYLERILREQQLAGINRDRSMVFLELARIHLALNEPGKALTRLSQAEAALKSEEEIEPPEFPIRVKWLGFYQPWTYILSIFYTLDYDTVYNGENHLAFELPTVNRYQYLYSLQAEVFRQQGALVASSTALQKLRDTAEEDDSHHGEQTLNNSYMRLAEVEYLRRNFTGARDAYTSAYEQAIDREDLQIMRKSRKNLLTIACYEIENIEQPVPEKIARVENEINQLDQFKQDYLELKIEQAKALAKEKNEDIQLTPGEIAKIKKASITEISKLMLYRGIFKYYLGELKNKQEIEPVVTAGTYDQFISRYKNVYSHFSEAINTFEGEIEDPNNPVYKIKTVDPMADRGLMLTLGLNKGKTLNAMNRSQEAIKQYHLMYERSNEFQSHLTSAVSSYRIFESSATSRNPSTTELERSFNLFLNNKQLITRNPEMFSKVARNLVNREITKKNFSKALDIEDLRRHYLSWVAVRGQVILTDPSDSTAREQLERYRYLERLEQIWSQRITGIRLQRGDSSAVEAELKQIQQEKKSIEKVLLSNPQTAAVAQMMLPGQITLGDLPQKSLPLLYVIEKDNFYYLFHISGGKTAAFENPLTLKEIKLAETLIRQKAADTRKQILEKIYGTTRINEPKATDEMANADADNEEKNAETENEQEEELPEFLYWLVKNDPRSVIADGLMHDFPFEKLLNHAMIRDNTSAAIYMFQNNRRATRRRITQITRPTGTFSFFGGNSQNWSIDSAEQQTITTDEELMNLAYWTQTLDYEVKIEQSLGLSDRNPLRIGEIFKVKDAPSSAFITYDADSAMPVDARANFMGGINLILAAKGTGTVMHNFASRSDSSEKMNTFVTSSFTVDDSVHITGNRDVVEMRVLPLQALYRHTLTGIESTEQPPEEISDNDKGDEDKGSTISPEDEAAIREKIEKEIKQNIFDSFASVIRFESSSYLRHAKALRDEEKFTEALAATGRGIDAVDEENIVEEQLFGKENIEEKRVSSSAINLETELYFLTGNPDQGIASAENYLAKVAQMKKEAKLSRKRRFTVISRIIWRSLISHMFLAGDTERALNKLATEKAKYRIDDDDFEYLLESYYMNEVAQGRLDNLNTDPPLIFKDYIVKNEVELPQQFEERIDWFLAKSDRREKWAGRFYNSLNSQRAFARYYENLSKMPQLEKKRYAWFIAWYNAFAANEQKGLLQTTDYERFDNETASWLKMLAELNEKNLLELQNREKGSDRELFAFARFYLTNHNIANALANYRMILNKVEKPNDIFKADAVLFELMNFSLTRDIPAEEATVIYGFISESASLLLNNKNLNLNSQRDIFYRLLVEMKNLTESPENLRKVIQSSSVTILSSMNQSVVNRMAYIGSTYSPEVMSSFSFMQADTYKDDRLILSKLKYLQRRAQRSSVVETPENRWQMNIAVEYYLDVNMPERALETFALFDRNQKPVAVNTGPEVHGLVETFNGAYYRFYRTGANTVFEPLKELSQKSFAELFKKQTKPLLFYHPLKENLVQQKNLRLPDMSVFTTRLDKTMLSNDLVMNQKKWDIQKTEKTDALASIMSIHLGPAGKEPGTISLTNDIADESGNSTLTVYSTHIAKNRLPQTDKNRQKFSVIVINAQGHAILYTLVDLYIPLLMQNKGIIEAMVEARKLLKDKYPIYKDYMSVNLVYH